MDKVQKPVSLIQHSTTILRTFQKLFARKMVLYIYFLFIYLFIYKVSKLAYRIWVILIANERVKKFIYLFIYLLPAAIGLMPGDSVI
jgi:hypothetical protein